MKKKKSIKDTKIGSDRVFTKRDLMIFRPLAIFWLGANLIFWLWWFQPEHIVLPVLFVVMSLALFYEISFLPSVYLFFLSRMRKPKYTRPTAGLKLAIITPCVPAKESIEIIEKQLKTMKAVSYPHDNWILDEENDSRVRSLASKHKVKHFSRKGVKKYNQSKAPFKAKTKAGNINAWLDKYGKKYDIFIQLDIDHHPNPDYANRVLRYFKNPKVAWVQAPSVYGNFEHWTARGAAEQDLVLQGTLQMGFYGLSQTPFIIGSHSTYRTKAVMEIGGFQPTRAEDHLDTVVLAAHGYQGVFLPEVIAVGDGPENFETYLGQQFAWAYSMIQILLKHTSKYFLKLNFKQKLQFLFAQTWYPVWSLSMGLLFLMPNLALLFNKPIASMPFGTAYLLYLLVSLISFSFWFWSLKQGWLQPKGLVLSWRGIVLNIARWPVVLWALINVLLGVKKPYMITAKGIGRGEQRRFKISAQLPYLALIAFSFLTIWLFIFQIKKSSAQGYLLFAFQGIVFMLAVYGISLMANFRQMLVENVNLLRAFRQNWQPIFVFGMIVFLLITTVSKTSGSMYDAITWRPDLPGEKEQFLAKKINSEVSSTGDEENWLDCQESEFYQVEKGENLWQIAGKIYGDEYKWQEIARRNNIDNPNLIRQGDLLVMPHC